MSTTKPVDSLRRLGQSIEDLAPASRALPDLDGVEQSLVGNGTELGGIGTAVLFWSAICSHCRRYDARLNGFESEHPGIRLVVVASRQNEDRASLRAAVESRGLSFRLVYDKDRRVAEAFGVQQTPRVFLLDGDGVLIYRGAIDNFKYPRDSDFVAYLDQAIDDLRAGRAVRRSETPSFGCPIESVYYEA